MPQPETTDLYAEAREQLKLVGIDAHDHRYPDLLSMAVATGWRGWRIARMLGLSDAFVTRLRSDDL